MSTPFRIHCCWHYLFVSQMIQVRSTLPVTTMLNGWHAAMATMAPSWPLRCTTFLYTND